MQRFYPINGWSALSAEQLETLVAFRVRFSEFQEHLGKTMRAVAIEEEVEVKRFGAVLAFMKKQGVLESAERWKLIRELRNAVNLEYEEDVDMLAQFFSELVKATSELIACHQSLVVFCANAYAIKP